MRRLAPIVVLAAVVTAACGGSPASSAPGGGSPPSGAGSASPGASPAGGGSPTGAASPAGGGSPAAASASAPGGGSPQPSGGAEAVARAFLTALAFGNAATAEAMEDATMRSAAPGAALAQLWTGLTAQFGEFGTFGDATATNVPPFTNITIQARFANATVPLIVTVSRAGEISGLHLGTPVPVSGSGSPGASPSASAAAYVNPAAFTEQDVTVGSGQWALPGTLSMPVGTGPFPGVVLVAGSGPQDRDETIGPNKPLRDLAWGLASNGIAVLRYDKRTLAHQAEMAALLPTLTVREETTDDAAAAIALLRSTPNVDPARVSLIGHSLGGYLAPRIAAQAGTQLHGIAMLEANTTPLPQLILEQSQYLANLAGTLSPSASAQLAGLAAAVARAQSPDLTTATPATDLPLGIPAAYWLDLRGYDPVATAAGLHLPMFFSQGGRDYQVPPAELGPWQKALAARSNVTFHTYPTLNHLLMAGTGQPTPQEYAQPGHVSPDLVADLVAWVRGS